MLIDSPCRPVLIRQYLPIAHDCVKDVFLSVQLSGSFLFVIDICL